MRRFFQILTEPVATKTLRVVRVLIALGMATCSWIHARGGPITFPVDDAYITLHNALVLGGQPEHAYVGASALTGATSPYHTLLVALLAKVMSPLLALHVAAWSGATAFALGILQLATSYRCRLGYALLLVVAGLTTNRMPHQLLNGLETGWALAAVTWALAYLFVPSPRPRWAAVILGALPILRPELAVLSALGCITLLQRRVQAGQLRNFVSSDCFWLAAGLAPGLALNVWQLGSLVPGTISAKKYFFAEGCAPAIEKLEVVERLVRPFLADVGLLAQATLFLLAAKGRRRLLWFIPAFFGAYYVGLPGALGHYEQRYVYVLLPLPLLGVAWALGSRANWHRKVAAWIVVGSVAQGLYQSPKHWSEHEACNAFTRNEVAAVPAWLKDNVKPDAKLLIHDAGYIAFASNFQLNDIVGLKTPENIALHREITWKTCRGERSHAIAQIAARSGATHLVVLRGWDNIFAISAGLKTSGFELTLLRDRPLGYDVYLIRRPNTPATNDLH
jgi:hypothetical protein